MLYSGPDTAVMIMISRALKFAWAEPAQDGPISQA